MTTLKNILLINAVSSGATGVMLTVAPGFFSQVFEVGAPAPFIGVGVFLIVFALMVFLVSRNNPIRMSSVKLIVIADSVWVVASLALLVLQPVSISLIGNVMIGAVAAWVLLMAVLQYNGQKTLTAAN